MSDFEIRGMEQLLRKLQKLPEDVARDVATAALMKVAEPVVDEAKARAPRRTGAGASHIEAASRRQGTFEFAVSVGPSVKTQASRREGFYLRFVELGTGPRSTKAGASRGSMPRKPFLRPALDAKSREAVSIAGRELARGIERAAK